MYYELTLGVPKLQIPRYWKLETPIYLNSFKFDLLSPNYEQKWILTNSAGKEQSRFQGIWSATKISYQKSMCLLGFVRVEPLSHIFRDCLVKLSLWPLGVYMANQEIGLGWPFKLFLVLIKPWSFILS